jgi:chemotaxis protein methyltransferase CheR
MSLIDSSLPPGAVERFRDILRASTGLSFEDGKLPLLEQILDHRLAARGEPCDLYLDRLDHDGGIEEISVLANDITIGETYFFRHSEQFRALTEIALPERLAARQTVRQLRILSAACASGEEPYTLAIIIRDLLAGQGWKTSIVGVDLNPVMLDRAREARYSRWALRETPSDIQLHCFHYDGKDARLDEEIKAMVHFEQRNLANDNGDLWPAEGYDVIFCRNLLMYFSPDQARALLKRIAGGLAPGGFLFLGHAETLRGLSDDFHLRHSHDSFYYQRKGMLSEQKHRRHLPRVAVPVERQAIESPTAWVDHIRVASEKVEALTTRPSDRPAPASTWDMAKALDLLRRENFAEALAYLRERPSGTENNPDGLLLEAILLTHSGSLPAAETVCRRLLDIDGVNPGAHYVLALCRESGGDIDGAARHDRIAAYLDPAFAMPRLHLGLLARRSGDTETARRELHHAETLLKHEDTARLLLFGGGFNRDSLIALCGSALRTCGVS